MRRSTDLWSKLTVIVVAIIMMAVILTCFGDDNTRTDDWDKNDPVYVPPDLNMEFWGSALPHEVEDDVPEDVQALVPWKGVIEVSEGTAYEPFDVVDDLIGMEEFVNGGEPRMWGWGACYPRYRGYGVDVSISSESNGQGGPLMENMTMLVVDGDRVLALHQDRGLTMFDISNKESPRGLGYTHVLGTPLGMVVHDGLAFVLSEMDMGYAMNYSGLGWGDHIDPPLYQIRSILSIVDLSDQDTPRVVETLGVEGYSTSGCRVGDTLLVFSNCFATYTQPYYDTNATEGRIISIDMDRVSDFVITSSIRTPYPLQAVHVTSTALFVASSTGVESYSLDSETSEVEPMGRVEIGVPAGGSFGMSARGGTLRVVTGQRFPIVHLVDVRDLADMRELANASVPGVFSEIIFRFFGERLVVFRSSGSYKPETIVSVVDLADVEDINETGSVLVGGKVKWVHGIGPWVVTTGFRDEYGGNSVAALLRIDGEEGPAITDTAEVVYNGEYGVGDYFMDASFIDAEHGRLFMPSRWTDHLGLGPESEGKGYHVLRVDLQQGALTVEDRFGTDYHAYSGPVAVATPGNLGIFLYGHDIQFLDLTVTDHVEELRSWLSVPFVRDARFVNGKMAWLVRVYPGYDFHLWIGDQRDLETSSPEVDVIVASYPDLWYWWGDHLVLCDSSGWFRTVDLTNPSKPKVGEVLEIDVYRDPDRNWHSIEESNPAMVGGGVLVFLSQRRGGGAYVHIIDIRDPTSPGVIHTEDIPLDVPRSIITRGYRVFIGDEQMLITKGPNNETLYKNHLVTVDLVDPLEPTFSHRLNIPGKLVGVSNDGDTLYTHASWPGMEYPSITFNALDLSDAAATIRWAIPVGYEVAISDDMLILTSHIRHRWRDIDYEGGELIVTTEFLVLDVSTEKRPRPLGAIQLFGEHDIDAMVDGYVVCGLYGAYYGKGGVVVFHLGDRDGPEAVGFFPVAFLGSTPAYRQGDYLILATVACGAGILDVTANDYY